MNTTYQHISSQRDYENSGGRMTVEDVKRIESFKHFTDEQCQELLETVGTFCEIVYHQVQRQQSEKARLNSLNGQCGTE